MVTRLEPGEDYLGAPVVRLGQGGETWIWGQAVWINRQDGLVTVDYWRRVVR